jgi:hypothetical protein
MQHAVSMAGEKVVQDGVDGQLANLLRMFRKR